jgi:TPR repeat protein
MKLKTLLPTLLLSISLTGASYANTQDEADLYIKGDYKALLEIIKPLANQGDAEAQNNLGSMYKDGQGVPKSDKQALEWYRKSADQGDAKAQYNLGVRYANGEGVLKDLSKAKYWIKKAYENPDASASTVKLAEDGWNNLS